jgi:hypothetical protein
MGDPKASSTTHELCHRTGDVTQHRLIRKHLRLHILAFQTSTVHPGTSPILPPLLHVSPSSSLMSTVWISPNDHAVLLPKMNEVLSVEKNAGTTILPLAFSPISGVWQGSWLALSHPPTRLQSNQRCVAEFMVSIIPSSHSPSVLWWEL